MIQTMKKHHSKLPGIVRTMYSSKNIISKSQQKDGSFFSNPTQV
jgi:hypothetical protein